MYRRVLYVLHPSFPVFIRYVVEMASFDLSLGTSRSNELLSLSTMMTIEFEQGDKTRRLKSIDASPEFLFFF